MRRYSCVNLNFFGLILSLVAVFFVWPVASAPSLEQIEIALGNSYDKWSDGISEIIYEHIQSELSQNGYSSSPRIDEQILEGIAVTPTSLHISDQTHPLVRDYRKADLKYRISRYIAQEKATDPNELNLVLDQQDQFIDRLIETLRQSDLGVTQDDLEYISSKAKQSLQKKQSSLWEVGFRKRADDSADFDDSLSIFHTKIKGFEYKTEEKHASRRTRELYRELFRAIIRVRGNTINVQIPKSEELLKADAALLAGMDDVIEWDLKRSEQHMRQAHLQDLVYKSADVEHIIDESIRSVLQLNDVSDSIKADQRHSHASSLVSLPPAASDTLVAQQSNQLISDDKPGNAINRTVLFGLLSVLVLLMLYGVFHRRVNKIFHPQ